jgi:hypothetical protein
MIRTYWMDAIDPFTDLTALKEWMDRTVEQVLSSFSPAVAPSGTFAPRA